MEPGKHDAELLKELQQLISEELSEVGFSRAFQPITDGLGLASPRKPDLAAPTPPATESIFTPPREGLSMNEAPRAVQPLSPVERMFSSPPPMKAAPAVPVFAPKTFMPERFEKLELARPVQQQESKRVVHTPGERRIELPVKPETAESSAISQNAQMEPVPPPMPSVGLFRRLFAFVIDQVFVWTVWLFALAVTLKVLSGPGAAQLPAAGNLQDPLFIRFALMEFATIWLGYLAIGVGVLDMTFGMWVWGVRLRYTDAGDGARWVRKSLRVVLSFLFFAPLLPSVLLALRRRGRNLLDLASGTALYRTMV